MGRHAPTPGDEVSQLKQVVRELVWQRLQDEGAALFPGAWGRIPNFRGAAEAADRLAATPEWARAEAIKCNPDAPQRPVRLRALKAGKHVYMAVPRLRDVRCFWLLDPRRIDDLSAATTINGAGKVGRPIHPRELPHVDLIVAGSVAVDRRGARTGKGGGYSDLEYAVGRALGKIDDSTVVATTIHPLQLIDEDLPVRAHDVWLDLIVTPDQVLRPARRGRRQPPGVLVEHLDAARRERIPVLRELGLA